MKTKKLIQLLVITALIISSAKADVFAQSSNPQPKMRFCDGDEVLNSLMFNIFNKSNPRFIYMLNKETKDSLYFVQIDVPNLAIINRKTVPNNMNLKSIQTRPNSPDMKWCFYDDIENNNGAVLQNLDNSSLKKQYLKGEGFLDASFDTVNKKMFLAIPSKNDGQLNGAIFCANYENNDTGHVLIEGVNGWNVLYDYKRNHIITVDYEENPDNKEGYRSLIQFFDANTGELVKQVIPYKSEINKGENANPHIYRIKMLKGGKKLCMFVSNYIENVLTLDLETYELKKIKSFQNNKFYDVYSSPLFYNSDSLMFCNEYFNEKKDSLKILLYNINTNQVVMSKIIRGEQSVNDWDLVVYLLENYGLFSTWDSQTEGCIKIYDLNDLEDNLSDIQTNTLNEIENLFPNPSNGLVQINLLEINTPLNITISNLNGEIIKTLTDVAVLNNQVNLNIQDLPTGSYFIRLHSANYLKTFKVMKGE